MEKTEWTPKKYREAVEQYVNNCTAIGILPDLPGMVRDLGFNDKTELEALASPGHEDYEEYAKTNAYAKNSRESWLARKMASDHKAANGCMNLLKQPENGGYIDKQTDKTPQKVIVDISGIPGGMKAFK